MMAKLLRDLEWTFVACAFFLGVALSLECSAGMPFVQQVEKLLVLFGSAMLGFTLASMGAFTLVVFRRWDNFLNWRMFFAQGLFLLGVIAVLFYRVAPAFLPDFLTAGFL